MAYIGKSPTGTGVRSRYYYTATGGETSLSGADDNSNTLVFSDGNYVDVSLNGIVLVAGTDYNTSTANTIAGLSALSASDIVEVVVYDIFTVADTVSAKDGGTFSGNVAMGGTLSVTGTSTLTSAATATGGLNVGTIKEATGTTTAITIDNSGQVLLPAIPFMKMEVSTSTTVGSGTNTTHTAPFNNVLSSRGITLNTSTYMFQVPVTGLYHFSGAVRVNTSPDYVWWTIADSGGTQLQTSAFVLANYRAAASSFSTSSGSILQPLTASTDYQIQFGSSVTGAITVNANQTWMDIFLVGGN
tara:strand:- start:184 stop:1086 length:903 start_codon:yes stop_codon:yes gene_type:complete